MGDETFRLKRKVRRLRKARKIAAKDIVGTKETAVLGLDLNSHENVGARFRERTAGQS